MYSFNNSDEVLRCPYNKHHSVPRSRFQRHLVKCEKNYPPDYKVICPYDATHRLNKSEIGEHIHECPMRNTVEASYIQPSSTHNVANLSEEKSVNVNADSYMFWKSQEEMRNFSESSSNSELRSQINGSVSGFEGDTQFY